MPVHRSPTLLLTRPRPAAERFATLVQGFDVVIAPLMEIVYLDVPVPLTDVAGVILTSENAVPALTPAALPAFCVGRRTAEVAAKAGFAAEVMGEDADTLLEALIARAPDGPLLHVHGHHVRGAVVDRLQDAGIDAHGVAAYDQRARPPDAAFRAALDDPDLFVPLFSPRSATLFAEAAPRLGPEARLFALSQRVSDALPRRWAAQIETVRHPDAEEMARAVQAAGMRRNSP